MTEKALMGQVKSFKSVLVVIDVQNDFCHGKGFFCKEGRDLGHVQQMMPNLVSLLKKCRQVKMPIVFVRTFHSAWTNSPAWLMRGGGVAKKAPVCAPNSWGAEFYEVQPQSDDYVVTKHRYSAFVGTDLDLVLRSNGFQTMLFAGVATNVCVESTLRDAYHRNYNVILVEDCCAAYSAEEHAGTLANVSKHFGIVTDSKTLDKIMTSTP